MRELVYLVGQISPKFPITYKWRQTVINHFTNKEGEEVNREQIRFIKPIIVQRLTSLGLVK